MIIPSAALLVAFIAVLNKVSAVLVCDSSTTSLTSTTGNWCFRSAGDGNGNTVVTVYSSFTGYFGLALGVSTMDKGDMLFVYNGACNSYTSSGHSVRFSTSNPVWTAAEATIAASGPTWATTIVTCKRPNVAAQTLNETDRINFIAAWSNTAVTGNRPQEHDSFISQDGGLLASVEKSSSNGKTPPTDTPLIASAASTAVLTNIPTNTINMIHGSLMFIAWCVSPFAGIFIARYLKDHLGVWWYRLHLGLMIGGTGILSVAALILRVLYKTPPHFETVHQKYGMALEVALVAQIVLGFISNAMWSPSRTAIPWWDKAHWWLGRVCVVSGVIVCYMGFQDYDEATPDAPVSSLIVVLFWCWIGLFLVAMLAGEFKIGQVHHLAIVDDLDHTGDVGDLGGVNQDEAMVSKKGYAMDEYHRRHSRESSRHDQSMNRFNSNNNSNNNMVNYESGSYGGGGGLESYSRYGGSSRYGDNGSTAGTNYDVDTYYKDDYRDDARGNNTYRRW